MTEHVGHQFDRSIDDPQIYRRLQGVVALFEALHSGELLAALPDCPIEREQHRIAMSMMSLAEREILAICSDLEC